MHVLSILGLSFLNWNLMCYITFTHLSTAIEVQFRTKVKSVQTDGEGELTTLTTLLFNTKGIAHRLACPHTHHQNGSVERKHRHVLKLPYFTCSNKSTLEVLGSCLHDCHLSYQHNAHLFTRHKASLFHAVSTSSKLQVSQGLWVCLLPSSRTLFLS